MDKSEEFRVALRKLIEENVKDVGAAEMSVIFLMIGAGITFSNLRDEKKALDHISACIALGQNESDKLMGMMDLVKGMCNK